MYMDNCLHYTIYYCYSYKALIQSLTDRYPLWKLLYQTFRVNHEYARIFLKYLFVSFLN